MKDWTRSSYCEGGHCVEVLVTTSLPARGTAAAIGVRNSQHPENEVYFSANDWREFIKGAKAGEFDLPELHG